MTYPVATILLALLAVALLAAMWWGWQRRARRTGAGLPDVPAAPAPDGVTPLLAGVEGVYVSSTRAGDWLDRVAAQDLGIRSPVVVTVRPDGVLLSRTGARDVFVPAADLLAVRRDAGIAGKVVGRGGLVVLTWRLGEQTLDTGVKPRRAADRDALVRATETLLGTTAGHSATPSAPVPSTPTNEDSE
ncbi:conserved hypothetical protein [Beutenbergia cavernae DSM 12333]|uniref:PH domain-containing protein n=1 Tax=Beutenbergia cavernae (strain ATCC BAA-8 / DSM 12333 / CCUG 43141 / JCM 11478 / NBRC 16432 / NCIMB 13614 / HKI 0122) TaxID=471853 RepID=C5C685_BEUC1|nr:hypothetical protein [Beutenbergia cavernae]ACQ80291.1 conserved hypothetical protein [Beutenbergia cavernae DSM 12333]